MSFSTPPAQSAQHPQTTRLRILATTDLHGNLLRHDYVKGHATLNGGLAGLARLINEARAQADEAQTPVVLLDNGDTFQGTPLATDLASREVTPDHPIVAAINHLRYDALGLGNHDLDHGLPYIKQIAGVLDMPLLNSNLNNVDMSPLRRSLLLRVPQHHSGAVPLTLGILSVLPMQSEAWNRHHLGEAAILQDPTSCVAAQARVLRKEGADLIIVLAHMGVGHIDGRDSDAQAAQALAQSGRVDALVLGHTHQRLPATDYAGRAGVNLGACTLGGVPAVMAGHSGSDLAVMDLDLAHDPERGWRITRHACALRPNGANVLPDPTVCAIATPHHQRITQQLDVPVAHISHDIHSYFSLVSAAPTQRLTARAHYELAREALASRPEAQLPLLATAAAHGTGGRDGIGNYVHIPKGQVLRRHIAGLTPFANQTACIRITGKDLHIWLEHAALIFNTLTPGTKTQMLINPDIPGFQFDTIFGIDYCINPTAPPYHRISQLRHAGIPVAQEQEFILATNQFRLAGGGGYIPTPRSRILATIKMPLQDTMIDILNRPQTSPWPDTAPWRFASAPDTRAILLTHPDALACLPDIAHLRPRLNGATPDGFVRLSITL